MNVQTIASSLNHLAGSLAVATLLCVPNAAQAQTVTYTVDPRQSGLILSASFGGTFGWGQFTITGQVAGAMMNCFEGSIVAMTGPGGSVIFGGGSSIRARLNPNSPSLDPNNPSFHPTGSDPNLSWSGVDNYGSVSVLYGSSPIHTAYRDLVLDITSGSASVAGDPASGTTLGFTGGHRDWSVAALGAGDRQNSSTWPISGGTNASTGKVTVSPDGSVLTIPVVLVTRSFDNAIVTFDEIWTGTIVAVAGTLDPTPPAPRLSLVRAGPAGLQFSAGAGMAEHYNGITTAPWVEGSWVGAAPATYSFTVTNPPALGASGFQAYVWLIANPISYSTAAYSGPANPNVVRLGLESDGNGAATATLGYKANAPNDVTNFFGNGFLCGITGAPFAGTWTISLNNDTDFTLTAPNGAQAHGSMQSGDAAFFAAKVRFYLGVNPNGAHNIGRSMTVSSARITTTRAGETTTLLGDFTTGAPLPKDWTILAADPASLVMMPSRSLFRAEWRATCGLGAGVNSLEQTYYDPFGEIAPWATLAPPDTLLANGTNIVFVTDAHAMTDIGFFRVSIPFSP